MSYNPLVNALNPTTNSIRVEGNLTTTSSETDKEKINLANDLQITYTYSDLGLNDQRISTITYTSISVGKKYVETYIYTGVAGNYSLIDTTTSVTNI